MEHKQGWFKVYNGDGAYFPEKTFEAWGSPWEIETAENGLKQFPCCGSTHPAITMALKLRKEEGLAVDSIAAIEILAHRRRLPHTNNPNPVTPLQAKFSIQYATARALVDGAVRIRDFEGAAVMEERVRRLLPMITAGPHPDMPDDSPKQFGAEVIVTMNDGRRLARRIDHLVCRGGDYPMTDDELFEKFEDCASRALAHDQIMPLYERLETLDKAPDIRVVTDLLEPRMLPADAAKIMAASGKKSEAGAGESAFVP
jgi:2-methylcitrate dehydratase PrpD